MPQEQKDRQITLDEWERMTFEKYGVPEGLRQAIVGQESGGDLQAKSPTGVRGRYQVTKATASQYGYDRDNQWEQPVAAAKHLRTLYDGVRKRHPDFGEKQAWLGASAEYYYGNDAFDADGNLSAKSRDGYSTPARYATSIAERWSALDRGDRGVQTRDLASLRPAAGAPKDTAPAAQYDKYGREKFGARDFGIKPLEWQPGKVFHLPTGEFIDEPSERSTLEIRPRPASPPREAPTASLRSAAIERLIHQFEGRKEEAARLLASSDEQKQAQGRAALQFAQTLARDIARRGGSLVEVGADDGGWPYVKFRDPERQSRSAEFDYRRGGMFAADRARSERAALEISPEVNERLAKMEEFERKPFTEQWERRIEDAVERGGREAATLGYRAVGAGLGAVQSLQGGKPFEVVDVYPERFKKYDEPASAALASRREAYRPSFSADVVEGIAEGAPIAAGATIATGLTGGGLPAAMAIGGGLSAAGADWENDPKRAAAQTALGAVAPVVGGKIGQKVAGRVASRFTAPAGQAAMRMAGEIGGGSAGNVLQSGAETAAFEGLDQISPRELAKQAAVGAGLSMPGALRSLRPSTGTRSLSPTAAATRAEIPILDSASRAPEARTGASSQIRAIGPAAEEAAIRARLGLEDAAPDRQGKAQAQQADGQETPTVAHRDPEIDRKPVLAETQDGRVIVPNPANKSGVSVVKDRSGEPAEHKFSSTQANLPKDVADEITAFGRRIPDRDLADDGRETAPHITLKYGLHGWDPKVAQEALADEGPIKVRFGKASVFQDDDADVVKVDVESPDLHRLNQKIAEAHPNTETHPTYEPHATIAYVRKGQGAKYAGNNFLEGRTITLDRILFSGRDGKQVEIPLGGRKTGAPAETAQVAGEPVSARWLNAQRRRAAEMLGDDPDQIPMIEEQVPESALQNLQTPRSRPGGALGRRPSSGQVLGSGFGALQGLFDRAGGAKPPKASEPEPSGSRRGRVFETIGAAQTVSQLGSPGFVLRNVIQHASHGAQEMVTQGVAGLIDKAASVITGKRTVGGFRTPVEAAREVGRFMGDYATGVKQARDAIKRGEPLPGSRLKDMPDPETLTAVGRRLAKVLTWINEVPDAGAWNAHFQRSMRDQARVFARSKPSADKALQRVDQMIERAWAEADHASMRDKNFASKTLGKMKEMLNSLSESITGTDKFGLGDFVIKYVQVPGALVKRGIEYSPLGVVEAGYYVVKGDQRRAVQSLSRAVTGSTSGAGVGAALAAFGILVGSEHDEGQLGHLEREEGRRGYSINLSALKRLAGGGWSDPKESGKLQAGDQLVGIDWLQPWALQASAGAAIYSLYSKGRLGAESGSLAAGKAVYDSMAKALDVMGDQSVLKNLGRYWARAQGATGGEKFASFLRAVGVDVPSSFVPSLARQARQVVDPFERDTRPEDPEGYEGFAEEAKNRALAQLPGVSQTFPARPSVLTGQSKKTAIGGYSMPVRSLRMISPAPFTTYEPQPLAREAARLTDAGYKVAFTPPKREKGERTSVLRRREERFAETFADGAAMLIRHPNYMFADDEMKAEAINDLAKRLRLQTRKALPPALLEDIIERAQTRVLNRESKRER